MRIRGSHIIGDIEIPVTLIREGVYLVGQEGKQQELSRADLLRSYATKRTPLPTTVGGSGIVYNRISVKN